MNNSIIPFNFQDLQIRVIQDDNGEPWFVASDVCKVLYIKNPSQATDRLDDDEKSKPMSGIGLRKDQILINESGLYSIVLRSDKKEAKPFKRWITHDVLPSIRKTGSFTLEPEPIEQPPVSMPELQVAEVAARMLRMSDTSKIRMLGTICEDKGISARFLPNYSDELLTKALGDLLKEHGSSLSARAANPILIAMGVLEEKERRSSRGSKKKFKSLTDYGLKFGKNETSVQSPNETQPRYYVDKFSDLLHLIDDWMNNDAA